MPRGDKSKYTDKQKRQAAHIEESYEKRGTSEKKAQEIAWATVNQESGGGKNPAQAEPMPMRSPSNSNAGSARCSTNRALWMSRSL